MKARIPTASTMSRSSSSCRFAVVADAPVRLHTTVTSIRQTDEGYGITTPEGDFVAAAWCWRAPHLPNVPALRRRAASTSPHALDYRNPQHCPTVACWSSARPPPACSWPMKSTALADT
jgi:hypothetical protein